jgi:hypothetical protein
VIHRIAGSRTRIERGFRGEPITRRTAYTAGGRMTLNNPLPTASLVRFSAAKNLTFVAASGQGGVEAVYADKNVWLSQKMMAQRYDVEVPDYQLLLEDDLRGRLVRGGQ